MEGTLLADGRPDHGLCCLSHDKYQQPVDTDLNLLHRPHSDNAVSLGEGDNDDDDDNVVN